MNTYTKAQAQLIAYTLEALETLPYIADGRYLRVDLMDELLNEPIGTFTNEEGVWLFEEKDATPADIHPTLNQVAASVLASNPEYYRDRKIALIKETRMRWDALTGTPSMLKETKDAAEGAIQELALKDLRAKLVGDGMTYEPDEDRAYAEHRERIAEQGTWFGAPGPLDEEPF